MNTTEQLGQITTRASAQARITATVVFLFAGVGAGTRADASASLSSVCGDHERVELSVSGNGTCARLNGGRIETSPDGVTWSERPLAIRTFLRGIAFGNGNFVAVGGSYSDEPAVIATSRDGIIWLRRTTNDKRNLYGVAFGNGSFIAVGDKGAVFTSTDGASWKMRRGGGVDTLLASVAFGKGIFVAGGDSGAVLTSTNGADWKNGNIGAPIYVGTIRFRDGMFLVTSNGRSFSSADGLAWTDNTSRKQSAFTPTQ